MAAGPDPTQDARASFRRGVQLYNEGSFEAALAEFNKAYQLSPNYRILYNIAQTQFDLHEYVEASKNLDQYVKEGARDITDERRAQVSEMTRKLEERIGQIEVTCNQEGAEIRIDDIPVGTSPLRNAVPVNAGPRRISAIKAGHPTVVRTVTIAGTEKKRVKLELEESKVADGTDVGIAGQSGKKRAAPSHVGLIASSVVAGGCAVATGVFGLLAVQAKSDFDKELKKVPGNLDRISDKRSKMKSYALATDVLGAATVLSAGAVVYFLITDTFGSGAPSSSKRSVSLAPTLGGLVLHGEW
jgi:tetratricopeptide (TPR) repeat protein